MFNVLVDINWVAVVLAALASFMFGGVWFTVLFGKAYIRALGKENAPKEKLAPIFIVGPFVCGLITAITSAVLMYALNIKSMGDALLFGAIVGFGYLVSTTVNVAINPNMPRPLFYGLISGGYFFIASLMVSVILVLMK